MLEIRKDHKDYGCLRLKRIRESRIHVNKKEDSTSDKKLGYRSKSYTRKSRRYNSYRGRLALSPKSYSSSVLYKYLSPKITTDTTEFKYYEVDTTGVVRQKSCI